MSKYVRICIVLDILLLAGMAGWIWFTLRAAASEPASVSGILASTGGSAPTASEASPPGTGFSPLEGVDLDVTYINRTPLYKAYCVDYPWDIPGQPGIPFLCPGTEDDQRWPEQGEIVTFTAHIVNKGTVASPAFDCAWHIDGVEVAGGTLPALAPAAEVTATYQWPWGHELSPDGQRAMGDHSVRFTADPANTIPETHESNNSLEDPTNAMSFRFYFTNHRLQAFDSLGYYIAELGTFGSGDGQFNDPQGLAVDRWGRVIVADRGNNRVVALDPQGNCLTEFTEPNDGYTGPFNAPRGVAVEPDGDLVVADTGNGRVVTAYGALPGFWRTWLPLLSRTWKAE